jgi:signal transduction histidine kinase
MLELLRRHAAWVLAWLLLTAGGGFVLARIELSRLRDAFETDARIAHRLLSQRVVQHDAVLATLALLQPPAEASAPEQRLPSVYPQILHVQRRDRDQDWPTPALRAAEVLSRATRRAALADVDFARGRYQMVLAAEPASFALEMDLRAVVPWSEWPMAPETSPVRVALEHDGQTFVLQPGQLRDSGWTYQFHKHLAADSQPFDVAATRRVGIAELPWGWTLAWALAAAAALAALAALQRQRAERQRAEELLRLGQVARLNTLGELAAGMAHELNQPLTAVLANSQAAQRLLQDEPPDLDTARGAMQQAVEQARRASSVVGRLRRAVERPATADARDVVLQEAVRNALYLLEPEFKRRDVLLQQDGASTPVHVLAEPVALEQIIHNLLMNALQALEQVPAGERQLEVGLGAGQGQGTLRITDSGPGLSPETLPRIFEPFFTTRAGGLGLGLSLCETLATAMGGTLRASAKTGSRGAVFELALPLSGAESLAP